MDVRPKTMKILEETIGSELLDMNVGDDFWDLNQKQRQLKQK